MRDSLHIFFVPQRKLYQKQEMIYLIRIHRLSQLIFLLATQHLFINYEGIPDCQNCPITGFQRNYNGVSFNLYLTTGGNIEYNIPTIEYSLGNTILKDIYILEDIPLGDTTRIKIKAIYYSDIYGIIRYDMYDDRIYELQIE